MGFKELAKRITEKEGGKVNLSIAQVNEVLRLALQELAKVKASEALALIEKYAGKE